MFQGQQKPLVDTLCPIKWANIARGYLRSKFGHCRDPSWVKLSVPFCPYIMRTVLRGQTDCSAPSGSCSVPSLTEEYGGAWNNINCSLFGTHRLEWLTGTWLSIGFNYFWFGLQILWKKSWCFIKKLKFYLVNKRLKHTVMSRYTTEHVLW